MFIGDSDQIKALAVNNPNAKDASMKVMIGADEGWDSHTMRQLELEPSGYSPKHSHPWPHINYVLEGDGTLFTSDGEQPIKKDRSPMFRLVNCISSRMLDQKSWSLSALFPKKATNKVSKKRYEGLVYAKI